YWIFLIISLTAMFIIEWLNRKNSHGLYVTSGYTSVRLIVYLLIWYAIYTSLLLSGHTETFIYFQF
ncbi:MAG: hypothetical protein II708_01285, partial [Paludibacteraceae bacterium]|nr:hypothetical protein [Paludibacteraceae bacterium]